MKLALGIAGILSLIVMLFPGIIIIGYFLLLVPGLILQFMPTAFLYLLATLLIRMVLPIENDIVANALALGIAVALASLAVQPLRFKAEADFKAAQLEDVLPGEKIALSGIVVIEEPGSLPVSFVPGCSSLCLAILDQPGVRSVTQIVAGHTATFALIATDPDAPKGEEPSEPGFISEQSGGDNSWEERQRINAYWQKRLAGSERLVKVATPQRFDWRLIDQADSNEAGVNTLRAVISDSDGMVRFRKSRVLHRIPTAPPYVQFTAGSAGSGFAPREFSLSSRLVVSDTSQLSRGKDELARAIVLKLP